MDTSNPAHHVPFMPCRSRWCSRSRAASGRMTTALWERRLGRTSAVSPPPLILMNMHSFRDLCINMYMHAWHKRTQTCYPGLVSMQKCSLDSFLGHTRSPLHC